MIVDGRRLVIPEYGFTEVDGEVIIYCEEAKKIVLLNKSATIVWQYIIESRNTVDNLSISDITDYLCSIYDISQDKYHEIACDVKDILDDFSSEGLFGHSQQTDVLR